MPNMDYPGPCASCIADNCGLVDENYSQHDFSDDRKERKAESKDEK